MFEELIFILKIFIATVAVAAFGISVVALIAKVGHSLVG